MFNVNDPRNAFFMWVLAENLAGNDGEDKGYNTLFGQISDASNHFREVVLTMRVNGIELPDPEKFLRDLDVQYDKQVQQAAVALVKQKLGPMFEKLQGLESRMESILVGVVGPDLWTEDD